MLSSSPGGTQEPSGAEMLFPQNGADRIPIGNYRTLYKIMGKLEENFRKIVVCFGFVDIFC